MEGRACLEEVLALPPDNADNAATWASQGFIYPSPRSVPIHMCLQSLTRQRRLRLTLQRTEGQ